MQQNPETPVKQTISNSAAYTPPPSNSPPSNREINFNARNTPPPSPLKNNSSSDLDNSYLLSSISDDGVVFLEKSNDLRLTYNNSVIEAVEDLGLDYSGNQILHNLEKVERQGKKLKEVKENIEFWTLFQSACEVYVSDYDIQISKPMGSSPFGEVFTGTFNGKYVSLKQIKDSNYISEPEFIRQVKLLKSLEHENLNSLLGITKIKERVTIVRPLLEFSLGDFIGKKKLNMEQKKNIGLEILKGLDYLHSKRFAHGDLQPNNILLDKNYHVKLTDFSISKNLPQSVLLSRSSQIRYKAPELLEDSTYLQIFENLNSTDVYSFAIIIAELIGEKAAFEGERDIKLSVLNKKRPNNSRVS